MLVESIFLSLAPTGSVPRTGERCNWSHWQLCCFAAQSPLDGARPCRPPFGGKHGHMNWRRCFHGAAAKVKKWNVSVRTAVCAYTAVTRPTQIPWLHTCKPKHLQITRIGTRLTCKWHAACCSPDKGAGVRATHPGTKCIVQSVMPHAWFLHGCLLQGRSLLLSGTSLG